MCYSALVLQNLKVLSSRFGAVPVRQDFEAYDQQSKLDPKRFPEWDKESASKRIFPNHFAAVVFYQRSVNELQIAPMRYQIWPSTFQKDPQHLSLFNARIDRIEAPFWKALSQDSRAIICVESFYEWVQVKDLVAAGSVTLAEITDSFEAQRVERYELVTSQGKRYKATKAENTPTQDRSIIIEFRPLSRHALLVPAITAHHKLENGYVLRSFAIITDIPSPDIERAGHDRQPIVLREDQVDLFLRGSAQDWLAALRSERAEEEFGHCLPISNV